MPAHRPACVCLPCEWQRRRSAIATPAGWTTPGWLPSTSTVRPGSAPATASTPPRTISSPRNRRPPTAVNCSVRYALSMDRRASSGRRRRRWPRRWPGISGPVPSVNCVPTSGHGENQASSDTQPARSSTWSDRCPTPPRDRGVGERPRLRRGETGFSKVPLFTHFCERTRRMVELAADDAAARRCGHVTTALALIELPGSVRAWPARGSPGDRGVRSGDGIGDGLGSSSRRPIRGGPSPRRTSVGGTVYGNKASTSVRRRSSAWPWRPTRSATGFLRLYCQPGAGTGTSSTATGEGSPPAPGTGAWTPRSPGAHSGVPISTLLRAVGVEDLARQRGLKDQPHVWTTPAISWPRVTAPAQLVHQLRAPDLTT